MVSQNTCECLFKVLPTEAGIYLKAAENELALTTAKWTG